MEYLKESHLGDVLKIFDAVIGVIKTSGENQYDTLTNIIRGASNSDKKYMRSITSQSNKLVMTFPVLTSNTIKPSTAAMISKAIERKCTLMIQMLFAADLKIEMQNQGGIANVINRYYNGIDFSNMSIDDMINVVEVIDNDTYRKYFGSVVEATYLNEIKRYMIKSLSEYNKYKDDIYEGSLNEYYTNTNHHITRDETMIIDEAYDKNTIDNLDPDIANVHYSDFSNSVIKSKLKDMENNMAAYMRRMRKTNKNIDFKNDKTFNDLFDKYKSKADEYYNDLNNRNRDIVDRLTKYRNTITAREKNKLQKELINIQKIQNDIKNKLDKNKFDLDKDRYKLAVNKDNRDERLAKANLNSLYNKDKIDYFKKQLMDTDVKKANELVPSLLIVRFGIDAGADKDIVQSQAIIGIKTRIIAIDSFDIMDKLMNKNKDKSGFIKLIRATTGEIKFIKDLIFAIDKAKVDAISKSNKGSTHPIWKVLERRAAVNNLRKALGQQNDASPITTLIITEEEVDYMKKAANMKLDTVSVANYILKEFNLMGLVIVDESNETARFLFDGEMDTFETLAYHSIERDNTDNSMYRKVINLMSKRV